MNGEKKKLIVTIVLLLALIVFMVVSQIGGGTTEDVDIVVEDDVVEVVDDVETEDDVVVIPEVIVPVIEEEVTEEDMLPDVEDVEVEVNDGIIIEDITNEIEEDVITSRKYLNESLGLSYEYPTEWTNNENSVPGTYTVRVEEELDGGAVARVDFRYYTASVDTRSIQLTNIAGTPSYFDENYVAQEVVTIPLSGVAKLNVGEWRDKALQVTYGVYSEEEMSDEELENLFALNMASFNLIIGSLDLGL